MSCELKSMIFLMNNGGFIARQRWVISAYTKCVLIKLKGFPSNFLRSDTGR